VPNTNASDVEGAVEAAQAAFRTYSKIDPRVRSQLLMKWSNFIQENKQDLAIIITFEKASRLRSL
jgi:malonate-semialdehyde dehydrogenase (acetylating)/methylmalonate-semialdehyde dehydrogenase